MIASFAELVAPLTTAEFLALLQRRKLMFRRNEGANRFADLLSWTKLRNILVNREFALDNLRVQRESVPIQRLFYSDNKKIDLPKIDLLMTGNTSLIVAPVDPYEPVLTALCDDIRSHTLDNITIGAIVTAGAGGAFIRHFDNEDLIILKIEGTKRWQIYDPTVRNPAKGMPKTPPPAGAPVFDDLLRPGDFLFLPAGHWHRCENGPEKSLHLGIFFDPIVAWQPINDLVRDMLSEELFRLPLTRFDHASDLASIEARVKSRLVEKISALSFGEAIAAQAKK